MEDARAVLDCEKSTNGFLAFNFECRCSKMYTLVKNWIDNGLIGIPLNTHCDYVCSEFHLKNSWRSKSSGTLIGEKLCHYLDLSRWWINSEVEEVYSLHAPNFVDYFNQPDNHQISYKFKNGAVGTLYFIMAVAESYEGDPLADFVAKQAEDGHRLSFLIYGTTGAIETDVFHRRIRRWKFSDAPDKLKSKLVETVTFKRDQDFEWFHNAAGHMQIVAELVAKNKKPLISAQESFEAMRLGFAAELSERENRVVKIAEL